MIKDLFMDQYIDEDEYLWSLKERYGQMPCHPQEDCEKNSFTTLIPSAFQLGGFRIRVKFAKDLYKKTDQLWSAHTN